jgi:hypothetical protein
MACSEAVIRRLDRQSCTSSAVITLTLLTASSACHYDRVIGPVSALREGQSLRMREPSRLEGGARDSKHRGGHFVEPSRKELHQAAVFDEVSDEDSKTWAIPVPAAHSVIIVPTSLSKAGSSPVPLTLAGPGGTPGRRPARPADREDGCNRDRRDRSGVAGNRAASDSRGKRP